ncbi:hypothetical protein ACG33_11100 [Steroidobacter denitrificans]|uniref:Urease accessory protein UreH-like transmembrane domain-containing protein n=1 Tax=Steroidobacter denitrificans TaxID=465721 RepID=A0A127FB50_STEDE|nr:sulfite exporter TauE/SafE family protein [Steroidobacter denitrificans]AMN47636.1 hypothetical protein ACG33_11100 [Steroidobacter denitrificans]
MSLDTSGMISLWAALIAGLSGSAHCFAMCGGLAGALGMRARAASPGRSAGLNALAYHLGRIGGYMLAGALCGAFGAGLQSALDLTRLAVSLRIASGVLLILVAIRLLSARNLLAWLDGLGARFWRRLQPAAHRAARSSGLGSALALGLMWGWLPCGLVYSMLLFAALSGTALHGATIMAAFGAGTLPSMLGSTLLASRLQAWVSKRWPRVVSGTVLLIFGMWMALAAIDHGGHGHGGQEGHAPDNGHAHPLAHDPVDAAGHPH